MALAPVLQIRQMVTTRSSRSVSAGYFGLLCVGFGLWVAYGASQHDWVLMVPNGLAFVVGGVTIAVVARYRTC